MEPVKVLLVDDLEENLISLEALLRRDGLVLLKARSGDEALELLLRHEVALALVDVQMPGLNGFEVAELMRGNERTRLIPIIFVTAGAADSQRRFKGYETGAVDFIQKPIEADIIRSKVDVFFELFRQRQQLASQRDELEVQALALKEAGRRKDEFLLTLTHDLSRHKNARDLQNVLIREINHRIKNLFSVILGLISLTSRTSADVEELCTSLRSRLEALAKAHDLTLPDLEADGESERLSTTVKTLLTAILAPYAESSRILITGSDSALMPTALTSLALLFHELATNAAKYGALSSDAGQLMIGIEVVEGGIEVLWKESGVKYAKPPTARSGFGSVLERAVVGGIGGIITREWKESGMELHLRIPVECLQ